IPKSDPKKFRTETPVATNGIRGSIYMGSFKDGQLKVLFQGGTGIDVYNEAGSVPVTIPGFGTRVTSQESPPEEPEPFTGEDIQDLELQPITASDKQEESDETDSEEEGSDETDSEEEDSDEEDSEEEDSGEEDSDKEDSGEEDSDKEDSGEEDSEKEEADETDSEKNDADKRESEEGDSDERGAKEENSDKQESKEEVSDEKDNPDKNESEEEKRDDKSSDTAYQNTRDEKKSEEETPSTETSFDNKPEDDKVDFSDEVAASKPEDAVPPMIPEEDPPSDHPVDIPDDPPTAAPDPVLLPGYYLGFQSSTSKTIGKWESSINLTLEEGAIKASFNPQAMGEVSFFFRVPNYNPDASYTGAISTTQEHSVTLGGKLYTFVMNLLSDPTGEFIFLTTEGAAFTDSGERYTFSDIGFAGIKATSLPSDGIFSYQGAFINVNNFSSGNQNVQETIAGTCDMKANWKNRKFMAHMTPKDGNPNNSGVIFGEITPDGIIFYTTPAPSDSDSSTSVAGAIYGSSQQGFGFHGRAKWDNPSNATTGETSFIGGGMRQTDKTIATSPGGTRSLSGFATGLGEGPTQRKFTNTDASNFKLEIDKDSGTLTGNIEVIDKDGKSLKLGLGGKGKSAYVSDDHFASLITDGTDINLIQEGGSYIYTAHPDKQFSDYVTWGYWGTAYKDASGDTYHLSTPNNFWIAGERTPESNMQNFISNNPEATYKGGAQGIMISGTGDVSQLTNGTSEFTFYFGSNKFDAQIAFDGNSILSINGGEGIINSGFSLTDSQNNTQLSGAFFGPNAEAIAGNFKTSNGTSNTYMGIFGGQR
ncbi:MAG: hypothetical protein MI742_03790, partial [Desulfobacterales bacterium]|nr:hypothetical protein [Desulfobacterales bacterium]